MTTRLLEFNVESGVVSSDTSLQLGTLGVMSLADEPVLLLEAGGEKGAERTVLPLQAASAVEAAATAGNSYVYHVDRASGVLQTYRVGNASTEQVCSAVDNTCEARFAFATSPIATAVFPPSAEQIVDVTFPTAADAVAGRTKSLADDSVMLKYTNRNVALVTTQSVTSEQLPQPMLHVTLVDTVSGKIIYRSAIESGSTPVHAALVENTISVFYWNTKAKRTELSSVHLYEGMVDKHGLTPFASKHSAATATKYKEATTFSSFLSVPPLAMQKTYVMPRAVTAVHHTTTTHGISNKNLLVAMSSGQVYMVDSRQISPRRPTSEPSQYELQDGLQQFTPFLMLNPLQCITHNYAMGSGAKRILSAPSLLESSSMVLSYGHPDVHFNRVLPSADFDLLGADFNYPLLTLLLAILGALVWYLQRMQRNKHIRTMWE